MQLQFPDDLGGLISGVKDGHRNPPPGLVADKRANDGSKQRGYNNCGNPTQEQGSAGIHLVESSHRNQSSEDEESKGERQTQAA
jgi:hypothetical protein